MYILTLWERLVFLYVRIFGEFASAAEQVEQALGFPRLRGELQVDHSLGAGETGSHCVNGSLIIPC